MTPSAELEQIEDALLAAGAVAVTLQDAEDQPVLEPLPGEYPVWDKVQAKGLFNRDQTPEEILLALEASLPADLLQKGQIEFLPEKNWVRSWMDHYEPMVFGELCICPEGMQAPDVEHIVTLDPGLAFGTGTHPTTALCIQWIAESTCDFTSCLDFGCGSGILALCAAKKGVQELVAVDIDPQAITATLENARKNDVHIEAGMPDIVGERQFSLVMANILAGPLVELAPQIASHTKQSGEIVLSGLLEAQEKEVIQAYKPWFSNFVVAVEDGWLRISAKKL